MPSVSKKRASSVGEHGDHEVIAPPKDDSTIISILQAVIQARPLRATAPAEPPAPLGPPGPRQNTSSVRRSLWTNHRSYLNSLTDMMAGRVVGVKRAIESSHSELEAQL